MKNPVKVAITITAAGFLLPAFGGTVITANLPAGTAIINIDATQDGAANYSGPNASLWYQPFSTLGVGHLLEYTVQPGSYGFRVINPTDAARMFPALTAAQTSQMFSGWSWNTPWATDYVVFDSSATNNASAYQLLDGAFSNTNGVDWTFYGDAASAYQGAITNGFYNLIRSGPAGRAGTNFTTIYTFSVAETLIFAVPDYDLSDNSGGVSVLISSANVVPVLKIISGTGTVRLQWPTNATGFTLAQTTNLQHAAWSDVTNLPAVLNSDYSVTLPLSLTTNRFFRLHNP